MTERRVDRDVIVADIDQRIRALANPTTAPMRRVRREFTEQLRDEPGRDVLAIADALVEGRRWVAYQLVYHHHEAMSLLGSAEVTRLGRGLSDWASVDAFGRYISGPAWQRNLIPDALIQGWTVSPSRSWRRAALVSTVPLNLRAANGSGDPARTLDICRRLASDPDDMVVKALSWALRELVIWDRAAVEQFLHQHRDVLAARIRREVASKLQTGRKASGARRSPP